MRWWRARSYFLSASLGAACLSAGAPAAAHGQEALWILPVLGADVVFTAYDLLVLVPNEHNRGMLIAQSIITTPQAAFFLAATVAGGDDLGEDETQTIAAVSTTTASVLSLFSIYALLRPELSTRTSFGISLAYGTDAALTTLAGSLAARSRFSNRNVAIFELVAAVPQLALATYAVASPSELRTERDTVLALGGWSSAIFTHGIASLLFYRPSATQNDASLRFRLSPTWLAGPLGVTPGLTATGVF